jgi:hypothetical protein
MNRGTFESIGLSITCFSLFATFFCAFVFLVVLLLPNKADATATVRLELDSSDGGIVKGHKVFVREEGRKYDFTKPVWQGSDSFCTINNLGVGVTYYFIARTYDEEGNVSRNSNEIKFQRNIAASSPAPDSSDNGNESGPEDGDDNPQSSSLKIGPHLVSDALDQAILESGQLASTQWRIYRQSDDFWIFDATVTPATTEIQVPRLILEQDVPYYFVARHIVSTSQNINPSQSSQWTLKQNYINTNLMAEDANNDGIPDGQEADPELDIDADGTPDALQKNIRCIKAAAGEGNIGIGLLGNDHNVTSVDAMETVSLDELPKEDMAVAPEMPFGLVNIRLLVNNPGAQAKLTVYLSPSTYPAGQYLWYRYDTIYGWRDHSTFISTLTDDKGPLVLKVTDGGDGDADGVQNGVVVIQSGPATSHSEGIGGGGTSRACFINSLF